MEIQVGMLVCCWGLKKTQSSCPGSRDLNWTGKGLTSALDRVGGQHHTPAILPLGKTWFALYRRLGGTQGQSGRVQKILPPLGFNPQEQTHTKMWEQKSTNVTCGKYNHSTCNLRLLSHRSFIPWRSPIMPGTVQQCAYVGLPAPCDIHHQNTCGKLAHHEYASQSSTQNMFIMTELHHKVTHQVSNVDSCQFNIERKQDLKDNSPPPHIFYDQFNICDLF
jgi:hypothetical protein